MNDVVIAGAGPNGLMVACELGLSGIRPIVLDPLPGPNPEPRANGVTGQGVRILDHRGFYSVLAGADEPPQPSPWAMFAALTLDLTGTADTQNYPHPHLTRRVGAGGTWPLAANERSANSRCLEAQSWLFRTDFVLIFLGHVLDGLVLRLRETFPRRAGARGGVQRRLRLTLKMRHHFGGEQFRGPFGRRRIGPLVTHLQHAAEPARLIPHPLHLFARPFGRADHARAVVVDDVDHLVDLLARHRHLRERGHLLEVPEP